MIARRALLGVLGTGALSVISSAIAQQWPPLPVIGFLSGRSPGATAHLLAAFHRGLADAGYVEGKNVAVEYRWAEGKSERLPAMAADLVGRNVAVISTAGGTAPVLAAKAATTKIPIVFNSGGDLVKLGVVASLRRPGGNVTGVGQFVVLLAAKRIEFLRELRPGITHVAMLVNPTHATADQEPALAQEAAHKLGLKLNVVGASNPSEIDAAFEALVRQRVGGLLVAADPFLDDRREQVVALAARHAIPAIYNWRDHVAAGGLISYGADLADAYRQAGIYTGRILKGANPAELPVMQPTKVHLVVNLKTAKSLGIVIPQSLQVRADEFIE